MMYQLLPSGSTAPGSAEIGGSVGTSSSPTGGRPEKAPAAGSVGAGGGAGPGVGRGRRRSGNFLFPNGRKTGEVLVRRIDGDVRWVLEWFAIGHNVRGPYRLKASNSLADR